MTREERKKAIEVLDDMKVKIDIPKAAKTQNDRNWALDVAIQALSQEPCDDAVSRQFMYELGATCIAARNENGKLIALGAIEELPPVTQKSGKWIDGVHAMGYREGYKDAQKQKLGHWIHFAQSDECSECGWNTGKYISPSKYCPNCGTEMKG